MLCKSIPSLNSPKISHKPHQATTRHRNQESMAETKQEPPPSSSTSSSSMLMLKLMSKRTTWAFLFLTVYTILLSLSWNFLNSVLSWYESTITPTSPLSSALYASMVLGLAFGVLSIVAALAVVVPATLVTWISVLVLLTFAGKGRRELVMEGKKLTAEIMGFVVKVLVREGNLVAVICAVLGYFALVRRNKQEGIDY